jgi:hypothetical protein
MRIFGKFSEALISIFSAASTTSIRDSGLLAQAVLFAGGPESITQV